MTQIILVVMGAMGLSVLLAMVLWRGRRLFAKPDRQLSGKLDPLTLEPLAAEAALVHLSLPPADELTLLVNHPTRSKYLQYGPQAFIESFSEWAYTSGGQFVMVTAQGMTINLSPAELHQRLFGGNDVVETVGLIHLFTEVDFTRLEKDDSAAVISHHARRGFDSLDAPVQVEQRVSDHTLKM
ncbi:MAG: hypothetical protein V1738_04820 [Patescibacteria group bacterium]